MFKSFMDRFLSLISQTLVIQSADSRCVRESQTKQVSSTFPFLPSRYSSLSLTKPLILWPALGYIRCSAAGIRGILPGTSWCAACACLILWQTPQSHLKFIFSELQKCRSVASHSDVEQMCHRAFCHFSLASQGCWRRWGPVDTRTGWLGVTHLSGWPTSRSWASSKYFQFLLRFSTQQKI